MWKRSAKYEPSSPEQFKYDDLDYAASTFRLIRVLAELESGYIACELKHVHLEDYSYRALSYTWGPESNQQHILVNGQVLRVRCNLWSFLNVARSEYEHMWFWIDAICINQENTLERNHQVREMAKIYENSEVTVIWLGPCWGSKCQGDRMHGNVRDKVDIRDLEKEIKGDDFEADIFKASDASLWRVAFNNEAQRRDRLFLDVMLALDRIFRHPYWTRLWIIQEVVLSPRRHIVTPNLRVSWTALVEWVKFGVWLRTKGSIRHSVQLFLKSHGVRSSQVAQSGNEHDRRSSYTLPFHYLEDLQHDFLQEKAVAFIKEVSSLQSKRQNDDEHSTLASLDVMHPEILAQFIGLLRTFTGAECSDACDKIFGLLALTPFLPVFPVNYGLDVYDLYFSCHAFFDDLRNYGPRVYKLTDLAELFMRHLNVDFLDLAFSDAKKRTRLVYTAPKEAGVAKQRSTQPHNQLRGSCDRCDQHFLIDGVWTSISGEDLMVLQCVPSRQPAIAHKHLLIVQRSSPAQELLMAEAVPLPRPSKSFPGNWQDLAPSSDLSREAVRTTVVGHFSKAYAERLRLLPAHHQHWNTAAGLEEFVEKLLKPLKLKQETQNGILAYLKSDG